MGETQSGKSGPRHAWWNNPGFLALLRQDPTFEGEPIREKSLVF